MNDISKVDRNFAVETSLNIPGIRFYDVKEAPFAIYGVFYENGMFRRLPETVARSVSEGVHTLHDRTAGGRVTFVTSSSYIAIKVAIPTFARTSHSLTGFAGFDLYVGKKEEYRGTFVPPVDLTDGYESVIRFDRRAKREITINFPLYRGVSHLYIGLEEDATLQPAAGYKQDKPLVFYGSSITQGGCASRPGNAYTAMVSRALQMDHINLGFSGNAKGEDEIANYIKSLPMAAFIYDYDHNAPSMEHLERTHQRMFRIIRQANPELPIIILSRPKYKLDDEEKQRLAIIRKTYESAIASGDKNVYFIDGPTLMQYAKNDGTVDNCHPNDLGFYSMARVLTRHLKTILN